jgi:hypothetical protein
MSASTPDPMAPAPARVGTAGHQPHPGRRFLAGVGLAILGHLIALAALLLFSGLGGLLTIIVEVLLLAAVVVVGSRAIVRQDPRFGWGILVGWLIGVVLIGVAFVVLVVHAIATFE